MTIGTIKLTLLKASPIRSELLQICATGVLRVVATLATVYLSKQLIDIATERTEGDMVFMVWFLIAAFGIMLLADAFNSRQMRMAEIKLQTRMQQSLFSHLLNADPVTAEKYRSGDLINRLELDVREVAKLLADSLPTAIITGVQLVAAFALFFILDSTLAMITFCIMPVCFLFGKAYMLRMRRLTHEIRQSDSLIQSHIQESIRLNLTLKALEASGSMIESAQNMQSELYGQVKRRTGYNVLSRTAVMTGFLAGYLAVFLWGVYGLKNGTITFGLMAAFLQLAGQIQRPVVGLAGLIPSFISGITSVERLAELEQIPIEESGDSIMLTDTPGIRFQNINFRYEERETAVFSDFSFYIPPGTSIAVVGETGAGKTTLIRLMLALLKPLAGNLTLYDSTDEHPISPLTRCNFVYVPQGNTLLGGTIRDNLLLAKPNASNEELNAALETACADFVFTLPDGIDTPYHESGGGLSEGQAQRISIARALLRPGKILLLDEATSALDADIEKRLLLNLKAHALNKTVIFITHRTAATELCDVVLRIE